MAHRRARGALLAVIAVAAGCSGCGRSPRPTRRCARSSRGTASQSASPRRGSAAAHRRPGGARRSSSSPAPASTRAPTPRLLRPLAARRAIPVVIVKPPLGVGLLARGAASDEVRRAARGRPAPSPSAGTRSAARPRRWSSRRARRGRPAAVGVVPRGRRARRAHRARRSPRSPVAATGSRRPPDIADSRERPAARHALRRRPRRGARGLRRLRRPARRRRPRDRPRGGRSGRSSRRRCASCARSPRRGPADLRRATLPDRGEIAQLVEHTTENRGVPGSSPGLAIGVPANPLLLALGAPLTRALDSNARDHESGPWCRRSEKLSARLLVVSMKEARWEAGCGGASPKGPSSGQTKSGASRSRSWVEGFISGEHVPERLSEPAGDVDLGDLRAALLAKPALGVLALIVSSAAWNWAR